jgi:hypothetical protein
MWLAAWSEGEADACSKVVAHSYDNGGPHDLQDLLVRSGRSRFGSAQQRAAIPVER